MIKILFILLMCGSLNVLASDTPSDENGRDYQLVFRTIKEFKKFDLMAELDFSETAFDESYKHYQIGARYLISDNFKAGLHLKLSSGNRHDEDWVLMNNSWSWQSTKKRYEFEAIPELDYRKWLFKSPLAATLRARYILNEFNENQSALLRVGLLRYWEKVTLTAQYEANVPLNYSEHAIDEYWFYFGSLLPISEYITIGHTIGLGEWRWSNPKGHSSSYKVSHKSTRFNIFLNYYF